jgi:rubrerythrin
MGFNPLKEKGVSLENQIKNWDQLNSEPYSTKDVHPYTRTRVILMAGAEFEGNWFKHQFARHCTDSELKQQIALTRRLEQQQQKVVNCLIPGGESVLEVTLGYEQVAVDLTACLAKLEPDANVKAALDFALLEDFDHLYRYANLYEMTEGKDAKDIVGEYTEIFPGRPTSEEHRHPLDSIRKHFDKDTADIQTKLNVMTIVAGEQQTMNFYMNVCNRPDTKLARGLYQEIGMIEEQHVSHYESLADPNMTWLERALMHEYNECYLYYSCMQSETDKRLKKIWEENLDYEIGHLHAAAQLLEKYEGRSADSILPASFPKLTKFEPNKEYVREILEGQVDLTADGSEYVSKDELDKDSRYFRYQHAVNDDIDVPSIKVINDHKKEFGKEYRLSTEGEHPVERLRD